ncbi:MauE/DoxX family redox-associated membrane protein [Flavobacterium sp. PL002]|uniref:MauE/DoxX family redox-associated membrane protein n=1 Tax=Flavobacterium sp. PL002 TaxID=1897058 RepID=UPI0017880113|nr:MauE/DoxX family redox-associated membrane protein [Flavobacterium sp. PL002]MBE0392030.1 hypothetical protein [Flavobacterium sp. PL002]
MTTSEKIKSTIVNIISGLFILLFTYAATNKLLDFENFKQQLGQSPLLSSFAEQVAWAVPAAEFLIVILLVLPKFKYPALISSFVLMLMFTTYIYIILNHSAFVPCSCGGILEKMNWHEHLIFNLGLVLLALIGLCLQPTPFSTIKKNLIVISSSGLTAFSIVIALFLISENIHSYHNKFVRRLSSAPATKIKDYNLKLRSYYFAGADGDHVYLGNTTSQLLMTVVDTALNITTIRSITLDKIDLPFRSLTIRVNAPYFYIYDGMVPCIFRGQISDWKAKLYKSGSEYFTYAEAIDSTSLAVRVQKRGNGESIIGKVDLLSNEKTVLNHNLLQKQMDGLFDTDGSLMYSNELNKIIYLYAYRNQFIVADPKLNLDYRGNTIDTIAHANIKLVDLEKRGERKFAKKPLLVNKDAAVYGNLLFVNSNIPGRYESLEMWKLASIVDSYNISSNSYLESFYVYDVDKQKLRDLIVQGDKLYALVGNHLICYKLQPIITANYKKQSRS